MFYWFQRGEDLVRYEARTTRDAYELVVIAGDGVERVERFDSSNDLARREKALIEGLTGEGWEGPHGWNL